MRNRFLLSKYGESVTDESAEHGDIAESWTEFQDRPSDVRDVVSALRECSELSTYPVRSLADVERANGCLWASTEHEQNYHTGEEIGYSVHLRMLDGSPVPSRVMWRVLKLARLVR
jgi:hypothetical protein